ncbi:MAG: hypothetical protein AUH92_01635 [Acidobacteria bacterium 13_1_40CM_4_69_4]|nr:MAG: hypothetical protein AUH92_01635 [Acidobacteria bacterium 13_1_40CM_4_69_4]
MLSPERPGSRRMRRLTTALVCAVFSRVVLVARPQPGAADILDRARSAQSAGRQEAALSLYDRALKEFRRLGDDTGAAVCLNNSSVILVANGDPAGALARAREAVRLRRALGDTHLAGRSLTNAGRALQQMGRLDEAEADYRQALAAATEARDRRDLVINALNLGVVAQARGLYGEALAHIRRAFEVIGDCSAEPWAEEQKIIAFNNRGALYERIGEFRLALADYEEILRVVGQGVASVPFRVNAATILCSLGDPNLALERLAAAEKILAAGADDRALHANLLSNVGLILHLNLRRLGDARRVLGRAYVMAQAAGDRQESMIIGNALGNLCLDLGRPHQAEKFYRRVLADLATAPVLDPAWEAHLGMARVLKGRGDRRGALRALLTAAALVEGSRLDLAAEMAPRRFLADRLGVYALLSSTLAEEGSEGAVRRGLLAAERARERLLLSRWSRHTRRAHGEARRQWHEDLIRLSDEATRTYGGAGAASWRDLEGRWEARSRVRLPETLAPSEALIEYLVAGEESRVFWLTRDAVGTLRLPEERVIERWSDEWLDDLAGMASGDRREIEHGVRLYERVVRPVLAALPPGIRALRIVPDGPLWRVPLDALPVEVSPDGTPRRLLQSHEISLLPLLSAMEAPPTGSESPLAYAFFGPAPAGAPGTVFDDGGERVLLPTLPEAQKEAAALRRLLGSRGAVFAGADSREATFRRLVTRPVGVLHLATHALANPFDIGRTGIVFSRERGADGFLSVPEILSLDLSVDLTFLSDSLAAALMESGSRAVVASLWDVQDLPARVLVEQFYDRLGRGASYAAALRGAKLALLNAGGEMARSRHWAPWILVGRGDATAERPAFAPAERILLWASLVFLLGAVFCVALRLKAAARS